MTQIKAKVAAMGALQGLRQDWGCQRAWARDYLSSVSITRVQDNGGAETWHCCGSYQLFCPSRGCLACGTLFLVLS